MRILLLALVLLLPLVSQGQERRAQSLIEKEKRLEAYELLVRAINKDSLASSEHLVLAALFIDEQFDFYNIDSAYFHVLSARENFIASDEKQQQRFTSNGYGLTVLDTLKKHIESVGFTRATNLGREEDYIAFMEQFTEAEQLDSAVILRDAEAFRKADIKHTYQAYEAFFQKYPQAIDVPEARTRYHRLLFEAKTASGKLAAYKKFLQDYPDTYHRQAVELSIFNIMTGKNTLSAYRQFIKEYPDSYLVPKAKTYAYARAGQPDNTDLLKELDFTKEREDSLLRLSGLAARMLILSHSGAGFQLLQANGTVLLDSLEGVAEQHKCEEFDKLILTQEPGKNRLFNLAGKEVLRGDFSSFSSMSRGFVKLVSTAGEEVVHIDGSLTTGIKYPSVRMLGGFLAYSEKDGWGLESITGIPMLKAEFDSLHQFNDYLILAKAGKWGIHLVEDFYPLLDQEEVDLKLSYDSIAVLSGEQLFIRIGDKTGVLDKQLKTIIPLGEPMIELLEDGYFLETNDSILDSRLANVWYSDIRFNDEWTIGLRSDIQDLYYRGEKIAEVTKAELLGRSAVLVSEAEKNYCYFEPEARIELKTGEEIKPIRKMGEKSVVRHYLFTDQRNRQSVINEQGKRVKIPRFDRLIDLGEDYMIFSVKGFVYNILDNKGQVVLKNVDAATSLDSGYISYLSNGKFGLLNNRNKTLIEPKYDKPLRRYDEERFIIEEEGKLGLIDRFDSLYIGAKYEEVLPLNDSIAVLKENFRWTFWNLNQGRIMLDNVSDYWEYTTDIGVFFKVFKGIGYGIWNPAEGMILNSTYDELSIKAAGNELVFITEKWVEEADLVVLLYYDRLGELLHKTILTTHQYEDLQCQPGY